MGSHEVVIAPSALQAILDIADRGEARRIRNRLVALETMPLMGAPYDPIYDSARPPHDLLVTFTGHHGIYYTYDEDAGALGVEYVEDCRKDPMPKFRSA